MKLVQAVILVLMILGIFAIIFCTRLLYSFSNEGFDHNIEKFHSEINLNKENINDTHCLIPNNLPMDKPSYAKVSGYIEKTSDHLVPNKGKYQFVKPQLLYDGIWKENINQIDGFAKNNWMIITDQYAKHQKHNGYSSQEETYGTNKFFDIKNEKIDGLKIPVDNCEEIIASENERRIQLPLRGKCKFSCEPDMEDMLGYRIA